MNPVSIHKYECVDAVSDAFGLRYLKEFFCPRFTNDVCERSTHQVFKDKGAQSLNARHRRESIVKVVQS